MPARDDEPDPLKVAADAVAEKLDADILLVNGDLSFGLQETVIELVRERRRRTNVALVLVTYGGYADPAYRIARTLQDKYEKFYAFVTGMCKSAGTLLVIGADEIVMSDYGDLGPLDIQALKDDELGQMSSGLTTQFTFDELRHETRLLFEHLWRDIKRSTYDRISFRTAAEYATNMTIGLMSPIYSQIAPLALGEIGRANNITRDYGERLAEVSKNLRDGTLDKLTDSYSHHGFVIDRAEASRLFENVREPDDGECRFFDALGKQGRQPHPRSGGPREGTVASFLSEEVAQPPEIGTESQTAHPSDRKKEQHGNDAEKAEARNPKPAKPQRASIPSKAGPHAGTHGSHGKTPRTGRNGTPTR
ncbi:MAG TPA: hypothetical protein VMD91_10565 [Candidatus Sulfotelmatobacter sp.]|nr:hypothetical protein [Candidatus Sulfotelmatobacter sp.]